MSFMIENRLVGREAPPFIVAEMSGNHNQSLDRALQIVDAAAEAGAHALKMQTYTADTMTLNINEGEFFINDPKSLWHGTSLYSLYDQAHTPWEWHQAIFKRCAERKLIAFSTPFDDTSVEFLEELHAPCYKIASCENTDAVLLRKVAATGKPIIISTGTETLTELAETVETVRSAGCKDLALLKCTSSYPATPDELNISTIPFIRETFGVEVGLSDHTLGIGVAIASIALGATIVEKHLTLRRSEGGVDSAFSSEPEELRALVEESLKGWQAIGATQFGPTEREMDALRHRRTLYVSENIQEGEVFTRRNIRAIRPGMGLPTKYIEIFLGKRCNKEVRRGTPLSWDFLA
jgi:pseudaminic acid synthase